jgi:hypothetical protein
MMSVHAFHMWHAALQQPGIALHAVLSQYTTGHHAAHAHMLTIIIMLPIKP